MTLFFPDLEAKYRREERAKMRAVVKAWYARQQDALRRDEPFDEPPPWEDDEDEDDKDKRYRAQRKQRASFGRKLMTLFFPDLEAKYRREGREEERAKLYAANRAWYARYQDALRRGEPFDEPPPWMDDEDVDADNGQ